MREVAGSSPSVSTKRNGTLLGAISFAQKRGIDSYPMVRPSVTGKKDGQGLRSESGEATLRLHHSQSKSNLRLV